MNWTIEEKQIYTDRAKAILDAMTLKEKVNLMSGVTARNSIHGALKGLTGEHYNERPYSAGGNKQKGIPSLEFCDGPNGVVCGRGKSTCFPVPMMRAATFDTALETEIGKAIGEEIIAYGGNFFGGVCINLPYHPGWGRSQETYGEDDFLLGEMGSAMVSGVQATGVIACLKHFAFNQMENNRFDVDVSTDMRTEREIFLRHFEKCVRVAGAGAVMSAYNKYHGTMCGHNDYLLNQVLKKEWNFDGFVISDFTWGVRDTVAAANGGQNIEMADTRYFGQRLVDAVKNEQVSEQIVDDAAIRIVSTLLYFEDIRRKKSGKQSLDNEISALSGKGKMKLLGSRIHRDLALRCAEGGITLLKNDNQVLPLSKKLHTLVVFGRLAEFPNIGDRGSSRVYPPHIVTPLEGIAKSVSENTNVIYYNGKSLSHAKRLLQEADAAVIVTGYDYHDEGEGISKDQNTAEKGSFLGGDRIGKLRLHEEDDEFLSSISGINPKTTVVIVGGSTIIPGTWIEKIPAVLLMYYAGMEGGTALANVLFGKCDPGGRLPFVIPKREEDLPDIDFSATFVRYDYWHGYRRLQHTGTAPMFPFGYGLSYTEFCIQNMHVEYQKEAQMISVICAVQNIGACSGSTVIQLYIKTPCADAVWQLRGICKVWLSSKEMQDVTIQVKKFDLLSFDIEAKGFVLMDGRYEIGLGFSADEEYFTESSVVVAK